MLTYRKKHANKYKRPSKWIINFTWATYPLVETMMMGKSEKFAVICSFDRRVYGYAQEPGRVIKTITLQSVSYIFFKHLPSGSAAKMDVGDHNANRQILKNTWTLVCITPHSFFIS